MMQSVAAPNVRPENVPTWLTGTTDFLSTSLDLWHQYEQIQDVKETTGHAQKETLAVVETTSPNAGTFVNPEGQKQPFAGIAGDKLQQGVMILGGIVGGVALLYFLTR